MTSVGVLAPGAAIASISSRLEANSNWKVSSHDVSLINAKDNSLSTEVAKNSFVIFATDDLQQLDEVLFQEESKILQIPDLPQKAVLLLSAVSHKYYDTLYQRIAQAGRPDILLVDYYTSSGGKTAAEETVNIWVSGTTEALTASESLLRDISGRLHVIPGGLGSASKVALVSQLLIGIHVATAAEATGLAQKAGLFTEAYEIVRNAAGGSTVYESLVPLMLRKEWESGTPLSALLKNLGSAIVAARELHFPLPLGSTAEQICLSGAAQSYGDQDVAGLVRLFAPAQSQNSPAPVPANDPHAALLTPPSSEVSNVAVIGLGAMGQGMARSLVRGGFASVKGYDIYPPSIEKFVSAGGNALAASSPAEAAKDSEVLVIVVQNAAQVEDVLFGSGKAADALPNGASVVLSSTVPPSFAKEIEQRLHGLGRGIRLVDAPVSGGVVRAANGQLTIICSGHHSAIQATHGALLAMAGIESNICRVNGGVGAASSVKLINQLLAGVHIAASAEAMAFASRLGLDTRTVFELFNQSPAWSWMFENRVPQMLNADWTPHSALAIFVKDLGIVLTEAKRLTSYTPISSTAHTLYLDGAARGWAKEADAGICRLWESAGASVSKSASKPPQTKHTNEDIEVKPAAEVFKALPQEYQVDLLSSTAKEVAQGKVPVLVVLDDDPTGTQTCHDIDVLTIWDVETLKEQLLTGSRGFFILTNSRALPPVEARPLIVGICENINLAAKLTNQHFEIVLRGDSTLRGHLPEEPEAVEEVLGKTDGWVLAPFFRQGGRFTINDVHYIQEGEDLVPAAQTPFAQDATFGYKNSDLKAYILEKCGARFSSSSFLSITLEDIRQGGPDQVKSKLLGRPRESDDVIIVNAVADSDMDVFVSGLMAAEAEGRRYLYRTAAAFVSSKLGIRGIPPLTLDDLQKSSFASNSSAGGLILAGSYVPKTTTQLQSLRDRRGEKLAVIELQVPELIKSKESAEVVVQNAVTQANDFISAGKDVLVMTSRALIKTDDALTSLKIGSEVAAALVSILENITIRPRYVIAKGGITSSDAATKGLRMRRARILGQAAPGVPIWRCEEETSRHRGVPFVVFPGNVGDENTLAKVVEGWAV
ncbi:unnamed protein product [Clonostachys solani]|uniref:Uncharacterized protein n=1 Tax=Clonostachys solani TaxID=160281 RepID=A0A9N9ZJL0_9HYPO|nr:unnamed protein product [Clonostachys solani]